MLKKLADVAFAYCFAILELFDTCVERTHAVVGIGVPLLVLVGGLLFLPTWVAAGIWVFLVAPAAAAAVTLLVHGWLLTRQSSSE